MPLDEVACVEHDGVDVLHQLQALVDILMAKAEALAHQLHEVEDLEALPRFEVTDLAVARVEDGREGVDPGRLRRRELALAELRLEIGQHGEAVRHRPHPLHLDVDQVKARNRPQDPPRRLDHARENRAFVERHPPPDGVRHQGSEPVQPVGDVFDEWRQPERLGPLNVGEGREGDLPELGLAARAPREHLPGAGAAEPLDRVEPDPPRALGVSRPVLEYPAAARWPAHHLVADPERIEDVEAKERDVRGPQHVAPGVEDDVGDGRGQPFAAPRPRIDPRQQVRRKLHPRKDAHAPAHSGEDLSAVAARRLAPLPAAHRGAGESEHEPRIDAVGAGGDAVAAPRADVRPGRRRAGALAPREQVHHPGDDPGCVRRIEPRGLDHRANLDALAAARAGVEHVRRPACEGVGECLAVVHAMARPFFDPGGWSSSSLDDATGGAAIQGEGSRPSASRQVRCMERRAQLPFALARFRAGHETK